MSHRWPPFPLPGDAPTCCCLSVLLTRFSSDKFPASVAFDAINEALNASEADRKDAIKRGGAVFAFTLKNAAGETESWHVDLKEKGVVAKGLGEKPNGECHYSEKSGRMRARLFERRESRLLTCDRTSYPPAFRG